MTLDYPFPATPEDFESLCLRLYRKHWDVPNLQKLGRRGDKQSGGDLVGTDKQGRVCFIQCKRRNYDRSLTAKEAEADIAAAKDMDPKVDRFGIATTSKRNPRLQKYIAKKNIEHQSSGLFSVELDSWDDINELLNQHPDIAASIYGPLLGTGFKIPMSVQQQGTINVAIAHLEITSGQSPAPGEMKPAGLHAEIDTAARYNTEGKPETAFEFLKRLQVQQWDRADAREKYRILANMGHAHRLMGNYDEAANAYRQAKQLQPQDENARWMEALASTLQDDLSTAHRLAAQLMRDFPEFPRATAVWVGSAPPDISFGEIESTVPASQRGDSEVAIQLAYQAAQRREWNTAEGYARKAFDNDPKWNDAGITLATILFDRQLAKMGGGRFGALIPEDRLRIEEGILLLSAAINELPAYTKAGQKTRLQVNLAGMHELLGNEREAGGIIVAAHLAAPDDMEVQRAYASYLIDNGRFDDGLALLRRLEEPSLCSVLLTAQALSLRKHGDDQQEAVSLLALTDERLAKIKQERVEVRTEWVRTLLNLHTYRQDHDAAAGVLGGQAGNWLPAEERLTWEAHIALAAGDKATATEKARRAMNSLSGDTSPLVIRQLALAFHRLEAYAESLDLWLRIIRPDHVSMETNHLLDCAQRTGRQDVVLDFCRRLRETGVFEPRYIRGELAILCETSPLETLTFLGELLEAPISKTFKRDIQAWRSYMAIQTDKTGLVDADPDHLPLVADLQDARTGRAVVDVLGHGSDPMSAVRYAYEVFRKYPNELDAHMAVVASILGLKIKMPDPGPARAGTAVMYKEADSGNTLWVVIEDLPSPRPALCEQGPETPIARALIGKNKGDTCVLREHPRRTGTVLDVVDKCVYRFRQCISEMESRFSGSSPIIPIHIPQTFDGRPDVEKGLEQVKEVCGDTGKAEQLYRDKLMSLHILGTRTGASVFEVVQRLAGRDDMILKCCIGAHNEREAAFAAMKTANEIVLDASALGTLHFLTSRGVVDVGEFLKAGRCKYIVSEHTLLMLRQLRQFGFQTDEDQLLFDVSGGQASVHSVPAEQVKRANEHVKQLIKTIESTTTVAPGTNLVTKGEEDKKLKEAAEWLLGKSGLDSTLLAMTPGRVLWTDDLATAAIVCPGLHVRRTWTQAVVFWLAERGCILREQEQKVTNALLRAGYVFTSLRPDHVMAAGDQAGWNVDSSELVPFISYFGSQFLDPPSRFNLARGVLKNLWQRTDLRFKTEAATFRILAALRTAPAGQRVIDALVQHADNIFGLDVMTAQAFRQAVQVWLQSNRGIILP